LAILCAIDMHSNASSTYLANESNNQQSSTSGKRSQQHTNQKRPPLFWVEFCFHASDTADSALAAWPSKFPIH